MFVEHEFYTGLSDVNLNRELMNTNLLRRLEDVAGMHSEIAGSGYTDIERTRKTWILLAWKVEVKKRPLMNDTLKIKTWSRCIEKIYAYRDFEVRNQYDEVVAIASSKWLYIDIDLGKFIKIPEKVIESYKQEPLQVFEEKDLGRLKEPDSLVINKIDFKITRNMIDVNMHLHNTYYLDIVKEVLPEEIALKNEFNNFEIMYKKEIKLGEIVKVIHVKEDEFNYVIIKSEDESILHAIIKLKYL